MAPSLSPSPLTAHLGYWLRRVSNEVSAAFATRLAELGVTVPEWVLLRTLLDEAPLAPSTLARSMGMTRGAITKLVDRLEARGLLRRDADPSDGRAQQLTLTGDGRALVPRLAAMADANDDAFFGALSPEARRALESTLRAIVADHGLDGPPLE